MAAFLFLRVADLLRTGVIFRISRNPLSSIVCFVEGSGLIFSCTRCHLVTRRWEIGRRSMKTGCWCMVIRSLIEIAVILIIDKFENHGPTENAGNSSTIPKLTNVMTSG